MPTVLVFGICLAFWLVLSGHLTPLTALEGAGAAAVVAALNRERELLTAALPAAPRFLLYLPWLLSQITLSSLQVARLVLDPRLPIDPAIIRVAPGLRTDLALTTFGNSITLTPGTVTLDVVGEEFVIHALTPPGPQDLPRMARRVAAVFGEAPR